MAEIKFSVRGAVNEFNVARNPGNQRRREIIEGGMHPGIYKLAVTHKKNLLGIEVSNKYNRSMHKDEKPYFSGFSIAMSLDGNDGVTGVKRSLKSEASAGLSVLKGGLREGINSINKDIIANYPRGRFWADVDLPSGNTVKIGFLVDNRDLASPSTIIVDGKLLSEEEAAATIKQLKSAGLQLPETIRLEATVKRLLVVKLTPKEMRESPFIGQEVLFNEPEHKQI